MSLTAAALSAALFPVIAEARPGGGGGGGHQVRGGARSSVQGARPAASRAPAAHANVNRGGSRPAAANRSANVDRAAASNRAANVDRTAVSNRTANVNRGANVNRSGNRVNTGNVNVGNNVNIDVDHDNGWGWGDHDYHPVAAGVALGTAAAVTSAALGARYYSLPPACSPYPYSGMTYYSCGGAYYAPQYEGDTVVYVVVDRPG
ncbi:MAG: hypothetical protein C0481_01420 [Phenylobacterium sp.]|nr:hypothetical protein [Phenylobacterium sp.]